MPPDLISLNTGMEHDHRYGTLSLTDADYDMAFDACMPQPFCRRATTSWWSFSWHTAPTQLTPWAGPQLSTSLRARATSPQHWPSSEPASTSTYGAPLTGPPPSTKPRSMATWSLCSCSYRGAPALMHPGQKVGSWPSNLWAKLSLPSPFTSGCIPLLPAALQILSLTSPLPILQSAHHCSSPRSMAILI